jgi:hypothetical protein
MVYNRRRNRLQGWLLFLVPAFLCASYYVVGLRAAGAAGSLQNEPPAINQQRIATPRLEKAIPQPSAKCPALVQQRKGIYNSTMNDGNSAFQNVLLLTAVNHQFENFLLNWQMIASDYNLKWLVLSLDQTIYDKLGGTSLLLPESQQVQSAGKFRTPSYIKLVCNKVRMVLELLEECQVEIVFSDVDNVFLQDPFAHHLGTMIRSQQYDYIYQTNHEWTPRPANHTCITEGRAVEEGNTGFHYLRPTANMKRVLQKTLDRCDAKDNGLDDQTLLWNVLREESNHTPSAWQHCPPFAATTSSTSENQPPPEGISQFCCLDPHYYPIGKKPPKDPSVLVTLHANYGARIKKKGKLKSWVKNGWRLPWG